jgi:hypothetical protein
VAQHDPVRTLDIDELRICANQVNRFYIESRIFLKIITIRQVILKILSVGVPYFRPNLSFVEINSKTLFRENVPLNSWANKKKSGRRSLLRLKKLGGKSEN